MKVYDNSDDNLSKERNITLEERRKLVKNGNEQTKSCHTSLQKKEKIITESKTNS